MSFGPLIKLMHGRGLALQLIKKRMRLIPQRIPLRIDFNVTKNCNLRCRHCYAALDSVKNVTDPSLAQIKTVINELYYYGCRWFRLVGGEPLLRDDIGDIILHARTKNMFVEINTNGLLVHKKIKELKKVDSICVSLDGTRETNDYFRGADVYEKVVSAIKTAIENNIKIRLHTVLTSQTMSSLDHMVALSMKYGVNMNFGEAAGGVNWQREYRNIPEDTLASFYKKYARYRQRGVKISNSLFVIKYVLNWPWKEKYTIYEDNEEAKIKPADYKLIPCQLGRSYAFIDVDGGMYPCTKLWKRGINYFKHGFIKAWDSLGCLKCVSCREMSSNELSLILLGRLHSLFNGMIRFI